MWISSFVVTLPSHSEAADAVVRALESLTVFTLGERKGERLPVVLETPDGATARYWHEWVEQLPGVIHVEVAFVSFEEAGGPKELANGELVHPTARPNCEPPLDHIGDKRHG